MPGLRVRTCVLWGWGCGAWDGRLSSGSKCQKHDSKQESTYINIPPHGFLSVIFCEVVFSLEF